MGIAGGLAVVALGAGFFLLSQGQPSSSAATPHKIIPLSQRHGTLVKHPAKPRVVKRHVRKVTVASNGLPIALATALQRNRVVVVSLYAPKVELDDVAMREAQAGASAAGVGFVALNVMSESQSRPLTKELGVLEDPAVLVYRRPNVLVVRFSGFADKQTVFQAARNAGL
jgi:hypothetical protein